MHNEAVIRGRIIMMVAASDARDGGQSVDRGGRERSLARSGSSRLQQVYSTRHPALCVQKSGLRELRAGISATPAACLRPVATLFLILVSVSRYISKNLLHSHLMMVVTYYR